MGVSTPEMRQNLSKFVAKQRNAAKYRKAITKSEEEQAQQHAAQMALIGQFYTGTDRVEVVHRINAKERFLNNKSVYFYCTIQETSSVSIRQKAFSALEIDFVEYFTADIWAARDRDNGRWIILEIVRFENLIKLKRVF